LIPIRFGAPSRQLYGLFQPSGGEDRRHCVVLCNPFGQEALRAHRMLKVLGDRLARAGFTVLRFDYFGTGDSDGEDGEGNLRIWVGDVLLANEEVMRRSGYRECSWFGLRLGATIAALASAEAQTAPKRMVLWDPVVDGHAYVNELRQAHAAALLESRPQVWESSQGHRDVSPEITDDAEALGFPFNGELRREIGELSAGSWAGCRAGRVCLVGAGSRPEIAVLEGRLHDAGTPCERRRISTQVDWASHEAMNAAIVPADALRAIMNAMSEDI
jgi:pimeloyl-ACP methyl ester carboxylesterase